MGDTYNIQDYENSAGREMKYFGKGSESELNLADEATFIETY